jgi:diguanylate cyclase (GGDEF)-like protein/PAS domain S-box-containing protein
MTNLPELPPEELVHTLQGILDSLLDPYVRLQAVRDGSGAIVDFVYVDANEAACTYNRRTKDEMIGTRLLDLLPGHSVGGLLDAYARVVESGVPLVRDNEAYFNEILGVERRSDLRCTRTGDGVSVMWRDVTEQYTAYQALTESEERFRLLAENASDVVVHLRQGVIAWVSPSIERVLGWNADQLVGRDATTMTHPEDRGQIEVSDAAAADRVQRYRIRLLGNDGAYHWFDGSSSALVRVDGEHDGRIASFRLVDAEVAAEIELERRARYDHLTGLMNRNEILEQITASGHHARRTGEQTAVLFCDIDKFKTVNDTHGHAAGDEVLRVMGERLTACVRGTDYVARIGGDELLVLLTGVHGIDDAAVIAEKIRTTAAYPIPWEGTYIHATLSIGVALAVPGEGVDPLIARADAAMFRAKQGGRDQVIAIPSPITVKRILVVDDDEFLLDLTSELLHQLGVGEVLQARDGAAALELVDNPLARPDVILCDVNMAGMDGIELLRHLSARDYRGALIVMSGSGEGLLASVGDLALVHGLNLVAVLRKPLVPDELLHALESMDPTRIDLPVEEVKGVRIGRLTAEEVRDGIDGGCIDIHVQPKVSIRDRRVIGVEALMRWKDPTRGMLSPLAIIPLAESHGMIDDLTMEVYRQSVDCLVAWRAVGLDLKIAVNLSTENLLRLDLPDALAEIARTAGVPTTRIVLEITENRLMEKLSTGLEVIGRLRLKGFGVSIDDYGMGYSNLRKLKQLPITELKVDRSFVNGADRDSVLRVILGSSIALGHSLGLSVVGEGVEDQEVWDLLETLGCDEAQGYFVSRPMPAAEFPEWKERWDATWA